MKKAYVILWKYSDGSANGVVRVYENNKKALEDFNMLCDHCSGMKEFEIIETEYNAMARNEISSDKPLDCPEKKHE